MGNAPFRAFPVFYDQISWKKDFILFHFPPQGTFVHSEKFSSFCAAVVEGIECLQNFFPLIVKGINRCVPVR